MIYYALQNDKRSLISVEGGEAFDFLQGLLTQDMNIVQKNENLAIWTGFLSPQGKYLYDFFVYKAQDNRFLLDVAAQSAEGLLDRLSKYALTSDVRITLDPTRQILLMWSDENDFDLSSVALPERGLAFINPQSAHLGHRIVTQTHEIPDYIASLEENDRFVEGLYSDYQIKLGVPELSQILANKDIFWLETGAEHLGGVSFAKGCYVGQEVTARMKHKDALKKAIVPVKVIGAPSVPAPMKADMLEVGTLLAVHRGYGLAFVHLEKWNEANASLRSVTAGNCMIARRTSLAA